MSYFDGMVMTRGDTGAAPTLPSRHLMGHQPQFKSDPLALMLRAQREVGDLARLRFGPFWVHLLSDPAEVYSVLVEKHKIYSKRTPGYKMLGQVLGQGLLTSEGDLWRRQRRVAQPAFHKAQIVGLTDVMRTASEDLAESWEEHAKNFSVIDVASEMSNVTLRIAGETLFGVDLTDDSVEVSGALDNMMQGFMHTMGSTLAMLTQSLPLPANLRMRENVAELDRVVREIIAERRKDPGDKPTLLNMFMNARDDDGQGMSDTQLRDEVLTMLLAGHETTANALAWTFYNISKHPEVARKLEAELDEVLDGSAPTMEQVRELPYTTQVLKESMRLYPPAWTVGRRAEEGDQIAGCQIPKGGIVLMSPYVLHRHPDYWENPEGFDPERFAPDKAPPPRGAYMPFIVGPRKCIGEHFAMTEAVIMVATLLSRYRLELIPGHAVVPEPSVTLRPQNGIKMRVRRR